MFNNDGGNQQTVNLLEWWQAGGYKKVIKKDGEGKVTEHDFKNLEEWRK